MKSLFEEFREADDEDIESAMKAVENWRKRFNKLSDLRWNIQRYDMILSQNLLTHM